METRSFETGEKLFSALAGLGWVVVLCAIALVVIVYESMGAPAAVAAGAATVVSGLIIVAVAQLGLAQIATAQATAGILEHLRKGAPVPPAEERPGKPASPAARPARASTGSRGLVKVVDDVAIERTPDGFEASGWVYDTVEEAEAAIRAAGPRSAAPSRRPRP